MRNTCCKRPKRLDFIDFLCYNICMKVDVKSAESWHEKYDIACAENALLQEKVDKMQRHIEVLAERIRLGAAQRFGPSGEQSQALLGGEQLQIFNEAEAIIDAVPFEPEPPKEKIHHPKKKGKRELDFDKLPRKQKTYELPENERVCPCCGKAMHACGHSVVRREIEFRPAKYVGVEHVETLYSWPTAINCSPWSEVFASGA